MRRGAAEGWLERAKRQEVLDLLDAVEGRTVLVFGDLVCDAYLHTEIDRISREAPVLIVRHRERELRPGGAANAAANVASLGGRALPVGLLGGDEPGTALGRLLEEAGCVPESPVVESGHETPVKTRVLTRAHHGVEQQVLRIDQAEPLELPSAWKSRLRAKLRDSLSDVDAVLVSDYGLGTVTGELAAELFAGAGEAGAPRLLDSRHRLRELAAGATVAAPNEPEIEEVLGRPVAGDLEALTAGARRLLQETGLESLVVTQGSAGMTVVGREGDPEHVPVFGTDEVADVTGAGDTVAAALSLALAAGATPLVAARLATVAAGLAVMKQGTSAVTSAEVREALTS